MVLERLLLDAWELFVLAHDGHHEDLAGCLTVSHNPCAVAIAGQEDRLGNKADAEEYKGPEAPAELETLKSESLSTVAAAAIAARAAAAARLREEEQKRRALEEEAVGVYSPC